MTKSNRQRELQVGPLIVHDKMGSAQITEPLSGCRVADGFPTLLQAAAAAKEMNDVADWIGLLETRSEGGRPNCQDELARIAASYGGALSGNATAATQVACARGVAKANEIGRASCRERV